MGDEYEVRLPTYINTSAKVTKPLNLNVYRNLHHHSLNTQKQNFHDAVKPLLGHIPRAEKIWIHYKIFAPRNGRLDTMNVGSIVDKYFSDTLVEAKKIMDDHFGHVVFVSFSFGGVCKLDGHAIATINILEEDAPMRIFLDDAEIKTAIENYVGENVSVPVRDLIFTSNKDGLSVEIVTGPEVPDEEAPAKPKNKGGRPAGSKNKPKPVPEKDPEPQEEVTPDAEDNSEDGGDGTDTGSAQPPETGAEEGAETTATEEAPKEGGKKKANLFGDEESQSSDSAGTSDTVTEEATPPVKKKSSIFDVK